ncbi:Tlg2-vesicle protein [Marasmius oreades]|uniref:Golgi apparatus membrane protein TVP38 n=1 Tax=Marasmius oreades TaxID=181124 RepID=A0A9P8AD85_9AGAR|nr:Tlg2-vesicle protein [Marasmius oreades]KAG7097065.1 Tlg2-vesicle protein [Marasmius oreades]
MAAGEPSANCTGLWFSLKYYFVTILRRYQRLPTYGKLLIWLVTLFYLCLGIFVIVVSPSRIAQFLYDQAKKLSETRFGWLVLGGAIILISFPPMTGHSTLTTLCGFAYGMKGFAITAVASVLGSALAFTILRTLFTARLRSWSSKNEKWQALESVMRAKGLSLIILVRVSPFPPWVYSNSLFASIESVSLWQFVVATLFIFPKLLLQVFVGSRIAALSDGDSRGHMDKHTRVLNGLLIGGGITFAICASALVYTLVQRHIKNLPELPQDVDDLAAEAIEVYDESAPLLGPESLTDDV